MKCVEAWVEEDRMACKSLFESMGFRHIRVFCHLRMSLETIHSNIGEHNEVKIRATQMIMDDIKLLNWLENDTFKENFDFRSQTVEETKYFVETRPWCDIAEYFFAYIDGKPVGNVGVGIDTKFIKQIGTAIMLYESKLLKATEPGVDDSN